MLLAYIKDADFRKSWSKPDRIAGSIYEVVSRGKKLPIRFPLGSMSWEVLRREVDMVAKEFDEIKELSVNVDSAEKTGPLRELEQFTS